MMDSSQEQILLVWDSDEELHKKCSDVIYWQSYNISECDGIFSVPRLVEKNSNQLRIKYLALIYELGQTKIKGKRVIDYLEVRPGLSFWWMTLLNEKCNFSKSPQIDNIIKLMAFREWFVQKDYKNIILVSSNLELANAVQILADELNIGFQWDKRKSQSVRKILVKRIYNYLPYSFQAILWLSYHLIKRWSLKGAGVEEWKKTTAKTTFISYLFNLDPGSVANGNFQSPYWPSLPKLLKQYHIKTNWLHIFVEDAFLGNPSKARKIIEEFNQSEENQQIHVTVHSFLSIRLVLTTLNDWRHMIILKKILRPSLMEHSDIYWPFLQGDYINSMVGPEAMNNLLFLNLFQCAMANLPIQDKGIYLQENQGWEFAFIYSWKNAGHGNNLLGIPHTPSKFWDLRSYFDKRNYIKSERCHLPLPDKVGINGDAAKRMYLNGGYPKSDLVEVEALRYLYLHNSFNKKFSSAPGEKSVKTLLVLGDYQKESTKQQMELLDKATKYINTEIIYIVKPHPACPIFAEDYPEINISVVNDPIPKLIDNCSFVYTSNMTSAAVDAYCAGKQVITALDPKSLNLSPLMGSDGVTFVSTPQELAIMLNDGGLTNEINQQGKDFFYLDTELPRWKELLVKNKFVKCKTGEGHNNGVI